MLSCPICSEILLPSDHLKSTQCGHIFHDSCLTRWIISNPTCPHCRQECSQTSVHRIYLPENNFLDQDSLVERMNDINRQKIEYESKYKKNEQEKKSLERELKQKNKEFHKVVQRSKNIFKGTSNIPSRHLKNATVNVFLGPRSQARTNKNHSQSSPTQQPKKRNTSRIQRSSRYFQRKKAEQRNNNNISTSRIESRAVLVEDVESIANSPDAAISVSSDSDSN